jgi:hypothetical protein
MHASGFVSLVLIAKPRASGLGSSLAHKPWRSARSELTGCSPRRRVRLTAFTTDDGELAPSWCLASTAVLRPLWRVIMDGTTFDQLIKRITTTRVSRLTALRGLAVGALAAAIGSADPDDVAAKGRNCGQCKKSKCHPKSSGGKKRCRCKKKANGTSCSIAGVPSAICSFGSCVASATPLPPPGPPPPPGFNCTTAGCVGANAGLVCNTTTGACVNCTSFTQCPTVAIQGQNVQQACLSTGFCLGGEACVSDPECFGVLGCFDPDFNTAITHFCLYSNNCTVDFGVTPATGGTACPTASFPRCILGTCTVTCNPGGNCGTGRSCQGGACLPTP